MNDLLKDLAALSRPRLLLRAARAGLPAYDRVRHLRRIARLPAVPAPREALTVLMAEEVVHEADRRAGRATYSVARHLEILITILAEVRLLPRLV